MGIDTSFKLIYQIHRKDLYRYLSKEWQDYVNNDKIQNHVDTIGKILKDFQDDLKLCYKNIKHYVRIVLTDDVYRTNDLGKFLMTAVNVKNQKKQLSCIEYSTSGEYDDLKYSKQIYEDDIEFLIFLKNINDECKYLILALFELKFYSILDCFIVYSHYSRANTVDDGKDIDDSKLKLLKWVSKNLPYGPLCYCQTD